ncbi:inactive tyrosine-protein kinase PRAG1-like [Anguilla rostrata]|uniref:inactive tyrosine-protein kinase PRAG1-like n=1 Tax=Anguilla rostrata TaxID=7938 RepID=UPI0030CC259B
MSACGKFADHLWKPGSCKNCFHPSSAHRSNGGLVQAKARADADEDNCVNLSTSYSKPTIAVRPTVMNPDTSDMLTDVNMNTEQDNQKYVMDKLSLMEMLELSPFYRGKNGCSRSLREVVMQNAASGKVDYFCRFSCDSLSCSAHQPETRFVSSVPVEGQGPLALRECGASAASRPQVTDPVKSSSPTRASVQEPERTAPSSGSCEEHRGIVSDGLAAQKQQAALANAMDIVATAPTSPVQSRNTEPPDSSGSFSLGCVPLGSPDHSCSCGSSLGELPGAPGPCSCPRSCPSPMDSSSCSTGQSWPQTVLILPSMPSDSESITLRSEPIYAESTKRKKKATVGSPSQQHSALEGALAVDLQGPRNHSMTGNTGGPGGILYLARSGSAVRLLCPHLSSASCKDSGCSTFQCCHTSTETNTGPLKCRPQVSPPIPPKRSSSSPKFEPACLSPSPHPEVHSYPSPPTQQLCLSQAWNRDMGGVHSPIPAGEALELRNAQNPKTEEQEEEEGGECGTPRASDTASVLQPKDWCPTVHCKESTSPGTARSGVSPLGLNRHRGNRFTSGTSCTAAQSEGNSGSHHDTMPPQPPPSDTMPPQPPPSDTMPPQPPPSDTMPPPPPPKKHHRMSGTMQQPNADLQTRAWTDHVEHFTPPFRTLPGGFCATSSDGPASFPRILSDGGGPFLPSLSVCLTPPLVWPLPDAPPSSSPGLSQQPPPLPEKRLVNRCVSGSITGFLFGSISGPRSEGGRRLSAPNPRSPPSWSEGDVSTTTTLLNPHSPAESQEHAQTTLSHALPPRTLAQPLEQGHHPCRAVTSCFSSPSSPSCSSSPPSLSAPPAGSGLHLQMLLSNTDSREGVYSKLGGLYAESLRRLALKCEEHFTRSQRNPLRFDESSWSLFKLTCSTPCCHAADAIYYSASCSSDPRSPYAVKICRSPSEDAKQGHLYGLSVQQSYPPHFNLQQDCGHFIARVPHSMLPPEENQRHCEQERVVVITREVPRQSAAGFVQQGAAFHRSHPEVYERRVCFLLLQLCNGLEHLKEHGIAHGNLCLENLLLVPPPHQPPGGGNQNQLPRLLVSGFAKAQRHSAPHPAADPLLTDRSRLAPEILSASQYRKFDEFQTGILIYELLHQPNPFTASPALKGQDYRCEDLPPVPHVSLYSAGLQRLAHLLLHPDPTQRLHIQGARRALQSLLWGPRGGLLERDGPGDGPRHEGPRHERLLSWLDVKRALLMMKFAERSLEPEQSAELEDWLCCQYFSSANPPNLCHTADLLYAN